MFYNRELSGLSLIANTKTVKGLKVACKIDRNEYETGIKISVEQYDSINICRNKFHREWNYSILPK